MKHSQNGWFSDLINVTLWAAFTLSLGLARHPKAYPCHLQSFISATSQFQLQNCCFSSQWTCGHPVLSRQSRAGWTQYGTGDDPLEKTIQKCTAWQEGVVSQWDSRCKHSSTLRHSLSLWLEPVRVERFSLEIWDFNVEFKKSTQSTVCESTRQGQLFKPLRPFATQSNGLICD